MTKIVEINDNQEEDTLYVTGSGVGTVTSVAVTGSAEFDVTGSPITDSGTIAIALKKAETLSFLDFDNEVSNNVDVLANTAKVGVTNQEENTINSKAEAGMSGEDLVANVLSLTQAEYDAGTPLATTFYIITDA